MPDYNPAIAGNLNTQPLNIGPTLGTAASLEQAQARAQLFQMQALQQQRQYNALQAASQAYRANEDPTASYLAAGGDPSGANSMQTLFANQRAMAQTPGNVMPQSFEALTGASKNLTETQNVNSEMASRMAGGIIADPSNDTLWREAVNKHYDTYGGPALEKQQLLAVTDPATRAKIAQAYSGQGVPATELNKPVEQNPGTNITTAGRVMAAQGGGSAAPAIQGLSPQAVETQKQTAAKTIDYLQGDGNKAYTNAQALMGSMVNVEHDIDQLGPKWMGSGAEVKGNFAKGWNSFVDTVGGPDGAKFDPSKVANWEEFNKEQIRAGMQLINSNFGGSREAASIIQMGKMAVPGVENSYLGSKYISSTIKAAAQRQIDLYEYQAQHSDQLPAVSAIQFNKDHPPQQYGMKGITDVIPQGAKQYLSQHPETAAQFNKNFGSGTAQFILANPQ